MICPLVSRLVETRRESLESSEPEGLSWGRDCLPISISSDSLAEVRGRNLIVL
jgi:hypothetical protein